MPPETRSGPPLEKVRYTRTRIAVVRGPNVGLTLEAAGCTLSVGTELDCDVVLTDDTVSRRHCEIELSEAGFRVRDMGSTNGVRHSGLRVYDVVGSEATEFVLGETTLRVEPLAETEDRERVTTHAFGDVLGASHKIRELFAQLERFAGTHLSVLIEGETGSGKDVVAESMHRASPRAAGPYVVFDCSAVAPTLIESELFGHERGAFTGATQARAGVFEQAHGGTLFLDEIGELPKDLQPKLLRALERREVKRLGSPKVESVDVRVLSATNRSLAAEVQAGAFRQDLYYRIAGVRVTVPPLRERLDDIPMLVEHFLKLDAPHVVRAQVPSHVWDMFRAHRWPGNVRELRNAVQRMVVAPELALHAGDHASVAGGTSSTPAEPAPVVPLRLARRSAAESFERDYLRTLLSRTQGNISRAAALAEVSRQMVQKLMRKHDVGELS